MLTSRLKVDAQTVISHIWQDIQVSLTIEGIALSWETMKRRPVAARSEPAGVGLPSNRQRGRELGKLCLGSSQNRGVFQE